MRLDNLKPDEYTDLMRFIRLKDIQSELDGKKQGNECLLYLKKHPQRITKQEFIHFCRNCLFESSDEKKNPMVTALEKAVLKYFNVDMKQEIKRINVLFTDKASMDDLTKEDTETLHTIQATYDTLNYPISFDAFCHLCFPEKLQQPVDEKLTQYKETLLSQKNTIHQLKEENKLLKDEKNTFQRKASKLEAEHEKLKEELNHVKQIIEDLHTPLRYETVLKDNDIDLEIAGLSTLEELWNQLKELETAALVNHEYEKVKKILVIRYTLCKVLGER